jgi:hypothetical protein
VLKYIGLAHNEFLTVFKSGISLVRSDRSNLALKRVWQKQGFCKKNTTPQIYLRRRPNRGGDCFYKTVASRNAMEAQTLLLSKPVKKFATDKDE